MLSTAAKPYIDASVPVLREHGLTITSVFYTNMLKAHPELKNLFNMGNQANGSQQQSLASAVFAYAANIDNVASLAPVIERIVHKHVSIGIKPAHYPIVGKYLIGAIKQVLGDAASLELISAWEEAYGLLASALIEAETRLYEKSGVEADSWMKMEIVKIEQQGVDIISLTLQAVGNNVVPNFKPGQYVSVATYLDTIKLRQMRQYSLSAAPGKTSLRISVKREFGDEFKPKGMVSNWIHKHVKVGTILDISHPYGNFTPDIEANNPIGLISAGVGITPMISILNAISEQNPKRSVLFAHAARSWPHMSHDYDVKQATITMPNLRNILFLNEVFEGKEGHYSGRMNLTKIVGRHLGDTEFYICGPQTFMDDQRNTLLELGVNPSNIHREVFGPESLSHLT